jgi:uncharacterized protein (DUF1800 family)
MRNLSRKFYPRAFASQGKGLPARMLTWGLVWSMLYTGTPQSFAHARHTSQAINASKLQPHERALQALNRLTFGPRPGDVEHAEAMGVDKWIEQQLHPETIDDSALEARLDSYPAMRLSERDLLFDFPSNALIRAASDGKVPIPSDPTIRAIYEDRIAAYQQKQAEQKQAAALAATAPATSTATTPAVPQPAPAHPAMGNSVLGGGAASAPTAPAAKETTTVADDASTSPSIKAREQHLYADLAATAILNLPPAARVAKIVAMPPAEFEAFQKSLTGPERRSLIDDLTPQQKETLLALRNPSQLVGGELLASRFLRDVYSNRQLEAVMTDFWLNHFNVYLHKGEYAPWYLVDYERSAIRPHAMGKFEDLLDATAQSPAMLIYLDNQQSIGPHSDAGMRVQMQQQNGQPPKPKGDSGLNENYARELMELHTLGVDGGYTQQDVTQVAEVFTGWGVDQPNQIAKAGGIGFNFNPKRHEPGPKTVLGATIQPSGQNEGLEVLHMLATSPVTARHISQQLAVRFVSDSPSPALVNSMTATWVKTGGDIREVLRTMFDSPEFWSKDAYRAKIKTPEEFVLSAVRATGGDVVKPAQDLQALDQLGMPFFGCQTPNGYPWTSNAWVNTGDLLDRINIAINIANNRLGVATDMDGLMANLSRQPMTQQTNAQQKENWLADALLSGPASPQTQAAILKQISEASLTPASANPQNPSKPPAGEGTRRFRAELPDSNLPIPGPTDPEASTIAGLLLGSPDFQRR